MNIVRHLIALEHFANQSATEHTTPAPTTGASDAVHAIHHRDENQLASIMLQTSTRTNKNPHARRRNSEGETPVSRLKAAANLLGLL